jgi:predicted transcriptional regulator
MSVRRSKLESYETILGALAKKDMNIDRLAYRINLDCTVLSKHLTFLIANGVVEGRNFGDKEFFAITERGITVFRTLDFQKHLKKLSQTLMTIDEATQDMSIDLRRRQKQSE